MARKNPAAEPAAEKTDHVSVASIAGTSEDDVAKLRAQVAELTEELGAARSESEKAALAAAEAQGSLLQRDIHEVPTGKTVEVSRCTGYKCVGYKDDGREILKPTWETVELPTFFYKIDMPPVGGVALFPNGVPFYQGTVYEVDLHTLRSWKEMVYRLWAHDRVVFGSNENFYRRPREPVLSAGGA